jgi:hypothetical protein
VIKTDDDMGGATDRYTWGQNEREVLIKCRVPAGTKSRGVQLTTTSQSIRLLVLGKAVCDGRLHAPILSDETLYALDDLPAGASESGERLLTVTMTKRDETRGSNHWPCAIQGEGRVDTSDFGVPVVTVNPNDPTAMKETMENLNSTK